MEPRMIGSKIAQARKKIDLSQAQLAERLFISPQAVGKWERGESVPDILTIDRLAKILDVDLNYFSENPTPGRAERPTTETTTPGPIEPDARQAKTQPNWDMSRSNWVDADFSGLKGLHEKFGSSNMKNCKFIGSDLSGLTLSSNNIDGCDFSGADIRNSNIQNSNLANNVLKACAFNQTTFLKSHILGCDLSGADLTGATIKASGFEKNSMTNAVLVRTAFKMSGIANLSFEGSLEDCSFEDCDFYKVVFRNTRLINTFFKNGRLKRIQFIDCQADRMTYEFLKSGKADLSGITLVEG